MPRGRALPPSTELAVARDTTARYNCQVKSLPPRAPDLASSALERATTVTSPGAPVTGSRLSAPLQARGKLWLEVDGGVALSEWRVALLEAIEATGSLARAAEQLGVPYRTASFKLREIEERLGVRLLAAQSGGARGGGSHLTAEGRAHVARWRAFTTGLDTWIDEHFEQAFGDLQRPDR